MAVAGLTVAVPVAAEARAAECQGKTGHHRAGRGNRPGHRRRRRDRCGPETRTSVHERGNDTVCTLGGLVDGGPGTDSVQMVGTDDADTVDLRRRRGRRCRPRTRYRSCTPQLERADRHLGHRRCGSDEAAGPAHRDRHGLGPGRPGCAGACQVAGGSMRGDRVLATPWPPLTRVWLTRDGHENGLIADACRMTGQGPRWRATGAGSPARRTGPRRTCHRPVVPSAARRAVAATRARRYAATTC